LSVVKSKILKELADNYPNFLKKDLNKLFEIIVNTMKDSLKKNSRVELRDIFTLESKIQKKRISRNPKNNEVVQVPEKKVIRFKMSKKWLKKINEKK
tara:strand:- start:1296 stop:1586 length:291 start_codon:yes stop_codon:yes gene_type:complete